MRRAFLCTSAVLLLFGDAATTGSTDPARRFLATTFNVTAAELARIDDGRVIARTLEASDKREVATFGIVRVRMTPEFYVDRLLDIASFKKDEAILQIGAFGHPPSLHDVDELTLDDSDVRYLRRCRVGSCGVQLSAEAIDRFRHEVDWRGPDARRQANALMRRILVEYVTDYQNAGGWASMQYADQPEPVDVRREFVALVTSKGGGWNEFPALRQHLVEYPKTNTSGMIDLMYWSKERVGRKAVASVTHLAISRTSGGSPAEYAVASKQIYGTHYFDASLGLTVLLSDPSASAAATYLVYVNRSRVNVFGGVFGGVARSIVTAKARATVSNQLARLQQMLERQFAAARPTS